jgi:hypothetical protein
MPLMRPEKITVGELREGGVVGILVYCRDHKCSHSIAISSDLWPDDVRLSDIEPRFACRACGSETAFSTRAYGHNRINNPDTV